MPAVCCPSEHGLNSEVSLHCIIMYHVIHEKMDNREFALAIHDSRRQSQGDKDDGLVDEEGEDPSEIILVSTVE